MREIAWIRGWSPPAAAIVLLVLSTVSGATSFPSTGPGHVPRVDVPHEMQLPEPGDVGPDAPASVPGLPTSPPGDPQVGDSWLWWLWVHDPMPPHFEQAVCTVRGMDDHAYVVVRDDEWLVSIDQADVDLILERWENSSIGPWPDQGIYENDTLAFGAPPDELDDDPRIYLVWFDFGIAADGFFFWFDEYPDGAYPPYHSNECEALYLNPYSSGGPSGNYMLAVAAHEFEHMIHWMHDDDEESWVDEGMAEMAMWLYGAPDNISGFSSNPDNSLVVWSGTWADYIKTYLWTLYFYERYGGLEALYDVVHEPANSIAGYESVLDAHGYAQGFADVFADWTVANYLDDTTIEDGRFGYEGDDLPAFGLSGTYSTYPVASGTRTVNHWAADYYRFQALDSMGALMLSFDGSDDGGFAVWSLALYDGEPTAVSRMTIEPSTQEGSMVVTGLSDPDDKVILVVAGISSTGGTSYSFTAQSAQGVGDGGSGPVIPGLSAYPNPFSTGVTLESAWSGTATPRVEIFDMLGRVVFCVDEQPASEGVFSFQWDGTGRGGEQVPPGLYLARIEAAGTSSSVQLLRL